jgi:choline dehydrogenase-like flavoprotein
LTQESYDIIVIGSGATGGFAAKELTERGLKVLVLEAGPPHGQGELRQHRVVRSYQGRVQWPTQAGPHFLLHAGEELPVRERPRTSV